MAKKYNTPHRNRLIKSMLTDEEYEAFSDRCKTYGMSQAEFIRQAITGVTIHPIIKISAASDELLSSVGRMTSEYGKIGSNLNQIARFLNETHTPYPDLAEDVRTAISELAKLKFEVLEKVGDAVGNDQTYQL